MLEAVAILLLAGQDAASAARWFEEVDARPGSLAFDEKIPAATLVWEEHRPGEFRLSWTAPRAGDLPAHGAPPPAGHPGVEDFTFNLSVRGHYSLPFGAADRNSFVYGGGLVVVNQYVSWADLFDPGWGIDAEVDFYIGNRDPAKKSPGFNYGIALLGRWDEYPGERIGSPAGGEISFGNLTANSILVGGTALMSLGQGGFYTRGLVAVGTVHYSHVNAAFSGPVFPRARDEAFKDTWTITSDFEADIGYRLGPLGIVAGIGLRIQAPPKEGDRISINSGAFWTFDMNLGLELAF